MKRKPLVYEAVKENGGTHAVKTRFRGVWYTAAETYSIPGRYDGKGMAEVIALALNDHENERLKNSQ